MPVATYHRVESPTQSAVDAATQQQTGELWGFPALGSNIPKVKAKAPRSVSVRRFRHESKLSVTVSPDLVTQIESRRGCDAHVHRLAKSLRGRMRGQTLEVTPSDVQLLLKYFAKSSSTRTQARVSKKAAKKK